MNIIGSLFSEVNKAINDWDRTSPGTDNFTKDRLAKLSYELDQNTSEQINGYVNPNNTFRIEA